MSDMEFPSPTPRRVRKPRWLDLRLVLGIGLVLVAVFVGASVIAHARHTDRRLAVTRDLAAGATLRADDLKVVNVALPGSGASAYLVDAHQAIGKVLGRPVSAGELLPAGALRAAQPRTTVTVPFAADAAPKLARGQRIEVWLSTSKCPSVVLLPDVTVQDVTAADDATFSTGTGGQDAVLSLAPPLAQRVVAALAIHDATIRAGVLSGVTDSAAATLAPLADCGAPSAP
jgi:hypothetical protein